MELSAMQYLSDPGAIILSRLLFWWAQVRVLKQ